MDIKEKTITNTIYHYWLYDLVMVDRGNSYRYLIRDLYNFPFKWTIQNDNNRAFEARGLREQFCNIENVSYNYDYFNEDVSMLELIIALAVRCESIVVDEFDVSASEFFWNILSNLGLDTFYDRVYFTNGGRGEVNNILQKVVDRRYSRSGKGGLFPLKFPKNDQRKVEIWYQMMSWLMENYF